MHLHTIQGIDIDLEHVVAVGPIEGQLLAPYWFVVTTILGKDVKITYRRGDPPLPESTAFDFGATALGREYYTGQQALAVDRAALIEAWRSADLSIHEHVAAALRRKT